MSSLLSTSRSTGTVLPFLSINGYVALTGCTPNVLTAVAIAAHKTADVIIFLTNGRDGVTSDDEEVARLLYKTDKPVVLAVNKIDTLI